MITTMNLHGVESIEVVESVALNDGGYMRRVKFHCRDGSFEVTAFAETVEALDIDVPVSVHETPAFLRTQAG